MRSNFKRRMRSASMKAVPPPTTSPDYDPALAKVAASILYRSPIPSPGGLPIYILNSAAFPDIHEVNYDLLLPYVLARLPEEDELLRGTEYEIIFFAGDGADGATSTRKNRPGWPWFFQAYYELSRAMRKRLQKLYVVHERNWVRILIELFSTIVSPKSRRKIAHVSSLSALAENLPIEDLLIPPSAYLNDRKVAGPDIHAPFATGRRAFGSKRALPRNLSGQSRLPRVLRETTNFVLMDDNMKTEGLFRIPPNNQIKGILREAYDRGQKFIVWREQGTTLPIPPYTGAVDVEAILSDIDQYDTYGVHTAAALIKLWYAELRDPLFPQSSYRELKRLFGNPDEPPAQERLVELLSTESRWPMLSSVAREILTRHLIPLLSTVTSYKQFNKMTAGNLGICFAPALVRGEDAIEDANMSMIVTRILAMSADTWNTGLRDACGVKLDDFDNDLQAPARIEDYDDPLQEATRSYDEASIHVVEEQMSGITMEDNDREDDNEPPPPPLPPRPSSSRDSNRITAPSHSVQHRKPAPPLTIPPPRYSTVISDSNMEESPSSYAAIADGFMSPQRQKEQNSSGWPRSQESSAFPAIVLPKRKALTTEQDGKIGGVQASNNQGAAQSRSMSESRAADQALNISIPPNAVVQRKAVSISKPAPHSSEDPSPNSASSLDEKPDFAKPTWAASSRRPSPTITSLARTVQPLPSSSSSSAHPSPSSLTTPVLPKPRAVSPGLMSRMSSFDTQQGPERRALRPGRLDLKKESVDDLRRLYEERGAVAGVLGRAGRGGVEEEREGKGE
ncbi:hypothetical protein K402DRAFT_368946 [Aulographum hederae CBS 113979]|uniref:Rho GTPase activation protein n=1 Tax=Aulographum hederae CBS 113979 TaxID=1176131 RepID=A0A6G1HDG9_9PEZI|nr:hypothetical protein K402DRAFT_368946 [Aulographum hederae CBS 113979]